MLAKVLIICAVAVYCNYPFCDANTMARYTPDGIPIPPYGFPYAPYIASRYPAGLHPALCPNFPKCDPEILRRHTPEGIPIKQWELDTVLPFYSAKYPPGINPALCPNYPFCDLEVLARYSREDTPSVAVEAPTA